MQNLKRVLELFKFKKNKKTTLKLQPLKIVFKSFITCFLGMLGKQLAIMCFGLIQLYYPYLLN